MTLNCPSARECALWVGVVTCSGCVPASFFELNLIHTWDGDKEIGLKVILVFRRGRQLVQKTESNRI